MRVIDFRKLREDVLTGLREYTGKPAIRGNQVGKKPAYPFASVNITTPAGENNGTWQQHDDGIDRLLVRCTMSISTLSDDFDESLMLATMAREWFTHSGRVWLSDRGITVQSVTGITNRDNILTVDYERKNGFDVVFYIFDEAENPLQSTGYIEGVNLANERKI